MKVAKIQNNFPVRKIQNAKVVKNSTFQKENSTSSKHLELIKNYSIAQINFKSSKFELGKDFEEISQTNIDKILPLYEGYQKGMNQNVDLEKLENFISQELKNGSQMFIIKENDKPAGFVHFSTTHSTIDMCPFFTIQAVFTDKEHRGKGLAKNLVNKVKEYSIEKNYKGVFVKTHAKNNASMGMYKNLDFKDESTKYGVFFWANDKVLDYSKGYVNTKK